MFSSLLQFGVSVSGIMFFVLEEYLCSNRIESKLVGILVLFHQ